MGGGGSHLLYWTEILRLSYAAIDSSRAAARLWTKWPGGIRVLFASVANDGERMVSSGFPSIRCCWILFAVSSDVSALMALSY